MRLVTAQRGGELLQMRWSDIDPKSHFWTIPGEFVKNAHGHRVYLNATARALLKDVPRREHAIWVFPKTLMGDYKHVGRRLAQSSRANIVAAPKQAGAALIIVTGTSHDGTRMEVAKALGADHVIDVNKEDPLSRIKEITGGKGVDIVLDCTSGAGTFPILLGVDALKRRGGTMVVQ